MFWFVVWKTIFNEYSLHRFNDTMAEVFFEAIQTIKYNGDASKILSSKQVALTVVIAKKSFLLLSREKLTPLPLSPTDLHLKILKRLMIFSRINLTVL